MKYFPLNYDDKTYNVRIERMVYANGNLALELITDEEEAFATLTVNLVESNMWADGKTAFVDTNNCPFAEDFIAENGLGYYMGYTARSGFCTYPLYRFDLEKI